MSIRVETPVYSGIPEPFVPFIESWRLENKGNMSVIRLEEPTGEEWQELSMRVTQRLAYDAQVIGICVIGQCGVFPQLAWTKSLADSNNPGRVSMFYQAYRHPKVDRFNMVYVTWIAFQTKPWAEFLPSLWNDLGPKRLHYGCNALIATFGEEGTSLIEEQNPPTTDEFCNSLRQARGWMTAMGDNLGFMVGLPAELNASELIG